MRLFAALISLSLIWGMSFMFIKLIVPVVGPWGIVFYRCLLGASAIFIYLLVRGRVLELKKKLPWGSLILVGIMNALIPWGMIALSEERISSSLAATLNATTPLFTTVLGALFFGRILKGKQWSGIIVGFIGILFLIDLDVTALFKEDWRGIVPMLLATACYGFASQYTKKKLTAVPVDVLAIITLSIGALGGLTLMYLTDEGTEQFTLLLQRDILISLFGLGVLGSGIAYLLFYYMIQKGSAEFATLVTYLVPVTALIWGSTYLNEAITIPMIVGLLCVFAGVYMSSRSANIERNSYKKSA
ncbi:DMT family transporter [Guptibacillus hwajinpoensis]|uniref:Drug/metabolite transporter (DMT)-like permease n=1 Tax=Guptibacillus hwajinpoensis TaxID=208199 RepID=A0ABU0K4M9_9BACL|nr:DMT family transporter [Alkalihalobacillus hemicentroti]MDQ0483338.1 drug/metabolite transporter (DMT)-like permease [Alkalihalobacillus hemicentroti]